MTSGVSWEIEGVDSQTRESAREAARRSGMSVGDWLDSIIGDRAGNAAAAPAAASPDEADDLARVRGRLDDVSRQLDHLTRLNSTQPYLRTELPGGEPPRDLANVISRLDQRLDQLIATGRSASEQLDRHVGRGPADLVPDQPAPPLAPDHAATPLEQALMEIAERQRALDVDGGPPATRSSRPDLLPRASTQGLSRLEEQLREITSRFEGLRPCGLDGAVETLRNDLAEIGLMFKEAMPRQAIEALESEVRGLSERLHHSQQGHSQQGDTTDAAIAGVERGLAEIRDALRALTPAENLVGVDQAVKALSQKIDLLATDTQDTAALEQLEGAIGALRGVVTHVASDGALAKLSDDVRDLAAKVDQVASSADSGAGLLATLEHRISSIAQTLETRNLAGEPLPFDLDGVVRGLADKLEQVGFARSDQSAVGQLEDRITNLIEKLDASNSRLDHLEKIEHGITGLLDNFEHQRLSQAESAAAGPDVSDLRREMVQTQDSLQTVQGALTHLVDRLAMIEDDLRSGSIPPAAGASAPVSSTAVGASSYGAMPAPTSATIIHERVSPPAQVPARTTAANEAQKPVSAGAHERRPIDPSLPPDHPLEPNAVRTGSSPVERIAASEAALGPVKPLVTPEPDGKLNFIAAARRAAQAASVEAAARDDKRPRVAAGKPASNGKPAGKLGDRIRKLLVAASVVAIVLGSLHLVASLFNSSDEPGADPQAQPQQQGDNQPGTADPAESAARNPGKSSGSIDGSDTVPAPAAPLSPAPGRQSLLIPMGDGSSMAFSAGGVATPSARQPSVAAPALPATAAPGPDVTGSIAQPGAVAPLSAPELTPASSPHGVRPPGSDKLPAAIGGALRLAAAKGDPAAEYEIAQRYTEGRGLPQDLAAAADWFDRAAKQGLAPAQFRLGSFYEKGLGVTKDLEAARRLYSAAADAGNAKAMHNLAVLYAEGIDGKPDYLTASKWFHKAADYGLSDSQYNLGILYARGIGVEANLSEAFKWFTLAARDGDREAVLKRDDIGSRLDQASLAAAKLAIQNFVPQQQPEAATQPMVPAGGWDAVTAVPAPSPKARNEQRTAGPKLDLSTPLSAR
jgi:localization factor PodJL